MKKVVPLLTAMLFASIPAYAAHGTIRETETGIFVEYYGDGDGEQPGKEVVAANKQTPQSVTPIVASRSEAAGLQPGADPTPQVEAVNPSKYPWQKRKKQWKKPEGWEDTPGPGIDGEDNY